ncbi:MAG TPA: helix-turn-helix transcriptional regulator [Pseudonocardia sp.]
MTERRHGLARIQVAATLRRMREQAGVPRDASARELYCTVSKIGDIETGRSGVKPAELEKLLDLYQITGADRDELIETARSSRSRRPREASGPTIPASNRRYLDLESQARSLTFFSSELLPGFLQTDGYARALLEWSGQLTPAEVDWRMALRAERRKTLVREHPPPPACWCIIGEAALRASVGGPAVMAEQLAYLLEWSGTLRHLMIQILPLGSGVHQLMGMTHTLLRFDPPARDVLHVDTYPRNVFFDSESDVADVTHALELIKAQAIGRQESLRMITRVLSDYKEMSGHAEVE